MSAKGADLKNREVIVQFFCFHVDNLFSRVVFLFLITLQRLEHFLKTLVRGSFQPVVGIIQRSVFVLTQPASASASMKIEILIVP